MDTLDEETTNQQDCHSAWQRALASCIAGPHDDGRQRNTVYYRRQVSSKRLHAERETRGPCSLPGYRTFQTPTIKHKRQIPKGQAALLVRNDCPATQLDLPGLFSKDREIIAEICNTPDTPTRIVLHKSQKDTTPDITLASPNFVRRWIAHSQSRGSDPRILDNES
ncbi:hypothetical protein HPB50_016917 [Hyalomma asiaticum]|uniref:Uncharacterized protein n=1 Tax=Hyalomma asiaticum TaxID=266040 RepID=A0ACB7TLF2_HYAAI|nr:hypothetical protein HPB50_016917 [Hyalomma asiaticum]